MANLGKPRSLCFTSCAGRPEDDHDLLLGVGRDIWIRAVSRVTVLDGSPGILTPVRAATVQAEDLDGPAVLAQGNSLFHQIRSLSHTEDNLGIGVIQLE